MSRASGDHWRNRRDSMRDKKRLYGRECTGCWRVSPSGNATILWPTQTCHVCGHKDERPKDWKPNHD